MRKISLHVVLLLSMVAPDAWAAAPSTEVAPSTAAVTPRVTEPTPVRGELRLAKVQVSERSTGAQASIAQLPARGTFWWLVGVIVVAGVILSVLL